MHPAITTPSDTTDPSALLRQELESAHHAAMSGLASVTAWSELLRTRNDLSPVAIIKHTEIIARLGHNATRLMTFVQRAAVTLDRLEHAAERRESKK